MTPEDGRAPHDALVDLAEGRGFRHGGESLAELLDWVATRLVLNHGEDPEAGHVLGLRERAVAAKAAVVELERRGTAGGGPFYFVSYVWRNSEGAWSPHEALVAAQHPVEWLLGVRERVAAQNEKPSGAMGGKWAVEDPDAYRLLSWTEVPADVYLRASGRIG